MDNLNIKTDAVKGHFQGHWQDFFSHFVKIESSTGSWYKILCPFHGDKVPSGWFNSESGRFGCHSCDAKGDAFSFYQRLKGLSAFPDVVAGIIQDFGISGNGDGRKQQQDKAKIVATYDWTDLQGKLYCQKVRYIPKSFRVRRPDGSGGWIWNEQNIPKMPYRVDKVVSPENSLILILEGEKAADAVRGLGFTATCGLHGAGFWPREYVPFFAGKDVAVLVDADEPGRIHGVKVAGALQGVAQSVKILELPGLPPKGDVSDWISSGGTAEDLAKLISECPVWIQPGDEGPKGDDRNVDPDSFLREWKAWPVLHSKALIGIAGRFVQLATRSSEADPAAVLITFLVRFGIEVGSAPFLFVGDGKHYARLMAVIVGSSSKARKGTSEKPVGRFFAMELLAGDAPYVGAVVSPGPLSSGEGLIHAVRDPVTVWKFDKKTGKGEDVLVDPGVQDKRLCVVDEEFASPLAACKREGNTLSTILRCMWDHGNLEPLTKNNKMRATGAHVGFISHITVQELHKKLEETEAFSGFGNRILWPLARRQGIVPFPQPMPEAELASLQWEMRGILEKCSQIQEMRFSKEARDLWISVYPGLSQDRGGLVGSITNRGEGQTLRLAMVYALLDASALIEPVHLEAALAVWSYCRESAEFIFGGRDVNPYSRKILELLQEKGSVTTKEIYDSFSRHLKKDQLEEAISELISSQKIMVETVKSDVGRPVTWFHLATEDTENHSDLNFDF